MCSICGIAIGGSGAGGDKNKDTGRALSPASETLIRQMIGVQSRRGPDGDGMFFSSDGRLAMGHGRLAIIDLENGGQPFVNQPGTTALAINGEIYNYRELAGLLRRKHHFRSRSDGEILLHLYEEYGIEAVQKLDGMFAFSLYDANRKKLFLGRDRLGKKPLNYFLLPEAGGIVFASLISALAVHPDFPAEVSEENLRHFMNFQAFEPESTVYRSVRRIPPGCVVEFDLENKQKHIFPYSLENDIPATETRVRQSFPPERNRAAEKLRELVFKAVEKRLEADTPMGAFLSGGTDSAIICAVLNEFPKGREMPLFTAVLPGDKYDESMPARETAAFLGKSDRHVLLEVKLPDLELLKKLIIHSGEVLGDASILPTTLICEAAKKYITVALGGDGADELFGGYERYRLLEIGRKLDVCVPGKFWQLAAKSLNSFAMPESRGKLFRLKRFCSVMALPPGLRYDGIRSKLPGGYVPREHGPENAEQAMEYDIKNYLPGDTLPKLDLGSMYRALEVRSPFLDDEVVAFARELPVEFKLDACHGKKILRDAFAPMLPKDIWSRRKRGFGVPLGELFRGTWRDEAEKLLRGGEAEHILQEHLSGYTDRSEYLFNCISYEIFKKEGVVK